MTHKRNNDAQTAQRRTNGTTSHKLYNGLQMELLRTNGKAAFKRNTGFQKYQRRTSTNGAATLKLRSGAQNIATAYKHLNNVQMVQRLTNNPTAYKWRNGS
jgi:hypothetical protein